MRIGWMFAFVVMTGVAAAGSSEEADRLAALMSVDPRVQEAARAVAASDARLEELDRAARAVGTDEAAVTRLDRAYEAEVARRERVLAGVVDALAPAKATPSGSVVALDDPLFDPVNAKLGMRDPAAFRAKVGGGVYLRETFAPEKTVVVVVHGMTGSPRDFREIIAKLDPAKYQVWMAFYASGDELGRSARLVGNALADLLARYPARRVAVIAHSLGGLVWRARELPGAKAGAAVVDPRVSAVYTLCTPHHGVAFRPLPAVRLACRILYRHLPPFIEDLLEGSEWLAQLQATANPPGVRRCAGGYGHEGLWYRELIGAFIPGPDDGLVPLASTPWDATTEWKSFDADHVRMLEIPPVLAQLAAWLATDLE